MRSPSIPRLTQHPIFHVCITSDTLAAFVFGALTLREAHFEAHFVHMVLIVSWSMSLLLVHKQCKSVPVVYIDFVRHKLVNTTAWLCPG